MTDDDTGDPRGPDPCPACESAPAGAGGLCEPCAAQYAADVAAWEADAGKWDGVPY
jgi:hypothetical protein